jgi:hypothetical protein
MQDAETPSHSGTVKLPPHKNGTKALSWVSWRIFVFLYFIFISDMTMQFDYVNISYTVCLPTTKISRESSATLSITIGGVLGIYQAE